MPCMPASSGWVLSCPGAIRTKLKLNYHLSHLCVSGTTLVRCSCWNGVCVASRWIDLWLMIVAIKLLLCCKISFLAECSKSCPEDWLSTWNPPSNQYWYNGDAVHCNQNETNLETIWLRSSNPSSCQTTVLYLESAPTVDDHCWFSYSSSVALLRPYWGLMLALNWVFFEHFYGC